MRVRLFLRKTSKIVGGCLSVDVRERKRLWSEQWTCSRTEDSSAPCPSATSGIGIVFTIYVFIERTGVCHSLMDDMVRLCKREIITRRTTPTSSKMRPFRSLELKPRMERCAIRDLLFEAGILWWIWVDIACLRWLYSVRVELMSVLLNSFDVVHIKFFKQSVWDVLKIVCSIFEL